MLKFCCEINKLLKKVYFTVREVRKVKCNVRNPLISSDKLVKI